VCYICGIFVRFLTSDDLDFRPFELKISTLLTRVLGNVCTILICIVYCIDPIVVAVRLASRLMAPAECIQEQAEFFLEMTWLTGIDLSALCP